MCSLARVAQRVLKQLRAEASELWGTSSQLYRRVDALLREIANPNLRDIPTNLLFRVELWDRNDQHIRWVVSASASVTIARAALDAANEADCRRYRLAAAVVRVVVH